MAVKYNGEVGNALSKCSGELRAIKNFRKFLSVE